jgi:tRNA(fMet)-specific endonuclease VapC
MLVLDTDHMTPLQWQEGTDFERLNARLEQAGEHEVVTTIISYEEQSRGWLKYVKGKKNTAEAVEAYRRLSRHLDVYRSIRALSFDERAATEFQRLDKLRLRIGTLDIRIAAIALANNATLLSRNLQHFRKVSGLRVEDWTK